MLIERFDKFAPEEWDQFCSLIGVSSPWHTWNMLNYYAKSCGAQNFSFLLRDDQGQRIGVCPLFLSLESHRVLGNIKTSTIAGAPLPSPLIDRRSDENLIRKNLRKMEKAINETCLEIGVSCAKYVYRSYSYLQKDSHFFESGGLFDLLALGYMPIVLQSVTIDLRKGECILKSELSKYHRKTIQKAQREGQQCIVIDSKSGHGLLEKHFTDYQGAHFLAAGRQTRPQSSFDAMFQMIISGEASLFINTIANEPISYLYCGQRNGIAFGWSQVNVLPNVVVAPRHYLEWFAIQHYLKNGFFLYDVGPKFYLGQFGLYPSEKLINIGIFKERFGGVLSPEIHYRKYFDLNVQRLDFESDVALFLKTSEKIPDF